MNRINGNVIIIDSAMGNVLALTSANQVIHQRTIWVNAISVYAADTSTSILLTGTNTAGDILFKFDFKPTSVTTGGGVLPPFNNPSWHPFSNPQPFDNFKAPVITAGTAVLYIA